MVEKLKTKIIAFDGTAASGKGTIAKLVAKNISYDYLNSGLIFRKIAYYCIKEMINLNDESALLNAISRIDFNKEIDNSEMYSNHISDITSQIAVIKSVRKEAAQIQRDFVFGKKGVVIDGRDIGTVVFPDADVKLFFDASIEERASRRYNQLQKKGKNVILSEVLECLIMRDSRDRCRDVAPLARAKDAFDIDTTSLNIEEVLNIVLYKIKSKIII
jgi:cytidylate kinase